MNYQEYFEEMLRELNLSNDSSKVNDIDCAVSKELEKYNVNLLQNWGDGYEQGEAREEDINHIVELLKADGYKANENNVYSILDNIYLDLFKKEASKL